MTGINTQPFDMFSGRQEYKNLSIEQKRALGPHLILKGAEYTAKQANQHHSRSIENLRCAVNAKKQQAETFVSNLPNTEKDYVIFGGWIKEEALPENINMNWREDVLISSGAVKNIFQRCEDYVQQNIRNDP